jgi:hypothetical protein
MYLLRDVLATAKSAKEGIEMIQQANRTCNLIIGVGDGKAKTVSGLEYSGRVAIPYADQDLLPVNADWHPVIPHVTYNAMDWLCPNYDVRMSESLSLYASAGALSIEIMIKSVLPTVQTGNLHAALYESLCTCRASHLSRPCVPRCSSLRLASLHSFVLSPCLFFSSPVSPATHPFASQLHSFQV